jgi:hypothetical protein
MGTAASRSSETSVTFYQTIRRYAPIPNTNRLIVFGETVAVYYENPTEHTYTLCGGKCRSFNAKGSGTYSNHYALRCQIR